MTSPTHRRLALALSLLGGTLAGCGHRAPESLPPPPRLAPVDRTTEIAAIVALLDQGDSVAASTRIDALLRRDPADPQVRVLRDSLDRDPVALLGPKSFAYTVKPGETMLALSERFLGNRLKSYQLARYNDIKVPSALAAGTVLRIPGIAPRAEPEPRATPRARGVSRTKPGTPSAGGAAAPAPAVARVDPAGARLARAAGLAALSQGRIGPALVSLRRAAALNPADPLIQRDLARAERIAATVRARR